MTLLKTQRWSLNLYPDLILPSLPHLSLSRGRLLVRLTVYLDDNLWHYEDFGRSVSPRLRALFLGPIVVSRHGEP